MSRSYLARLKKKDPLWREHLALVIGWVVVVYAALAILYVLFHEID